MALIINGVCRFSVNQTLGGREVVNLLDYQIDTTGSSMSRVDAIEEQAGIILQEWSDSILNLQVDDLTVNDVSWVDLDEEDGSTGTTTDGSGAASWPDQGGSTGAPLPANVSGLVQKNITATRQTRNGRMYLAGLPEVITAATNGNVVDPTELASINSALEDFLGDTNQSDGGFDSFTSQMAVVHTLSEPNPSPPPDLLIEGNGWSPVQTLVMDALLATQRRRLRG